MATAKAMTECEIMRLEKAAMIRVLHDEPSFSEIFVSHLLARTIRVEEDLMDQLFNSNEKRLARALLLLAKFSIQRISASRLRARLTRLFTVPTARPQICAASS
jgi:CRP-like cAMP-binding protein